MNVAVVGTGFMGWVHVEALRRIGVNVAGIAASSLSKAEAAAARFGIPQAYASFDDILADESIGSVHIGTPNRLHFEMAKRCILAGKHVMCEKPLAMNSDESAELVELAAAHPDIAAGVNYNIRFYPLCIEAKSRVQAGELGDLFHVNGCYIQDWLAYPSDYNWRVLADEGGELRAIADIGTHWLDLIHSVTGLEVESLCSDLCTVYPNRTRPVGEVETFQNKIDSEMQTETIDVTTEDFGAILIRYRGGTRGTLHVSQVNHGRKNCLRFELAGSKQSIAWNSETPNEMWMGHRDKPNEVLTRDPALLADATQAGDYPGGHNEGYSDSFKYCFRSFYDYIENGVFDSARPFATFADGHREIVLCEAILQSHQEGRWVDINA